MRRAWALPVVMAIPLMKGISGDDDGTYAYGPPHGRYARFAMPAMFGALATDRRWLLLEWS